jgi:hypothetical protein
MQSDNETSNTRFEASHIDKQDGSLLSTERVGFCRPPETTRFKKGISGNPKGRPKGSLNVATAFTKALREKVVINEAGKRKTVTKLEAALKQLVNKAASGEITALKQLVELARDAEAKQTAASASQPTTFSEIDREVMEGILKRFEASDDHSMEAPDGPQSA